ncbi:MAG TPA: lipid-A-disaccharide synthase [Cyclobacteriaceae bacterium]|nr:lipid-A-disaccharide synthase [Cyclobacteriaceae bacterium]
MRYYLIAGERSGDLHGGNLIRAIRDNDPQFIGRGFGGNYMQEAGMDLALHYDKMAFMGFTAVLANFRTISAIMKQCKADILSFKPDVVILIDYGGFNMRIAKFAKANGLKVFFYISPKVWAWNTSRAWKLKATVDRMFCILPFEKEFYKKFDWEVDYVGNPVLDAIKKFQPDPDFLAKNGLNNGKEIVALLPGSRRMELKGVVPIMAGVAKLNSTLQFVVAGIKTLPPDLYAPLKNVPNVRIIFESTYDLLSNATAALVTSGTATLETALFKVPEALLYKTTIIEEAIVRSLIKIKWLGLVNLIADKNVVRELYQSDFTVEKVNAELDRLIADPAYRNNLLTEYDKVYKTLDTGSASENAGRLMVNYLKRP